MSETDEVDAKRAAFALAVVSLAREHGVNRVSIAFNLSGEKNGDATAWGSSSVTARWLEGENGAKGDIHLSYEQSIRLPENPIAHNSIAHQERA